MCENPATLDFKVATALSFSGKRRRKPVQRFSPERDVAARDQKPQERRAKSGLTPVTKTPTRSQRRAAKKQAARDTLVIETRTRVAGDQSNGGSPLGQARKENDALRQQAASLRNQLAVQHRICAEREKKIAAAAQTAAALAQARKESGALRQQVASLTASLKTQLVARQGASADYEQKVKLEAQRAVSAAVRLTVEEKRLRTAAEAQLHQMRKTCASKAVAHKETEQLLDSVTRQNRDMEERLVTGQAELRQLQEKVTAVTASVSGYQCAVMEMGALWGAFPPIPNVTIALRRGAVNVADQTLLESPGGLDMCLSGRYLGPDGKYTGFETLFQYATGRVWRRVHDM